MVDTIDAKMTDTWFTRSRSLGLGFWIAFLWLFFVLVVALCADLFELPDYGHIDWKNPAAPPGSVGTVKFIDPYGVSKTVEYTYWLGTDTLGRDIVTRLIYGARVSLLVGLLAPAMAFVIGGTLGLMAGYFRGRLESVVVASMDIILAFPGLVLLLAMSFYFGPGIGKLIPALAILIVPAFCRVSRANVLTWAQREFILAARAIGASDLRILRCHLLPNVFGPVAAYGLMVVAVMIIAEGALSFLGLSVPAPIPSWGGMVAEGKELLDEAPHICLIPSLVMFLTVLSFNLLGDRLRESTGEKEA
jgi:peptide/nickel transport system permease protein